MLQHAKAPAAYGEHEMNFLNLEMNWLVVVVTPCKDPFYFINRHSL